MLRHILLAALMVICIFSTAQIPNAGFEDWETIQGYELAKNWVTLDLSFPFSGVNTLSKSNLHSEGLYSARLMSRYSDLYMMVIPAWIFSGTYDSTLQQITAGIPFNSRPYRLKGDLIYDKKGGDFGLISCDLTRWDTLSGQRVLVATDVFPLTTSTALWTVFEMELTYLTNDFPDTCTIYISASSESSAIDSTTLWVDNLRFDGVVGTGESRDHEETILFPNPSAGPCFLKLPPGQKGPFHLSLYTMAGSLVWSQELSTMRMNQLLPLDFHDLVPGSYLFTLSNSGSIYRGKLNLVH